MAVLGNIAMIVAGDALEKAALIVPLPGEDGFGLALSRLSTFVVISGILIAVIYYWMNARVLTDPRYYSEAKDLKKGKESKPKLSIGESIKYLFSSKYLGFIALLVLGYGVSINLIEVTWKGQVREAYPDSLSYTGFMGSLYKYMGALTICILLATKGVVQRFGWAVGAMATPVMILLTGGLFFVFVLFRDSLGDWILFLGTTPLMAAVYVGAVQNMLGKGTKYSLFDPTREMAYIPLDQELKIKGKAAVDVIGGRFGKSGGGWIQMALLTAMGSSASQMTIAPYLAILLCVVCGAWIWSVFGLSKQYHALIAQKGEG